MKLYDFKSKAWGDTHDIVLSLLHNLKKGSVLDVGAGEGFLSYRLLKMGFHVTAVDVDTSQFKLKQIKCDKIDLNSKLKYDTESFDYILGVEILEHLRNPGLCLDEFQRILKYKGVLIISVPNIVSLVSRIIFLFSGQYNNFYNTEASCVYPNTKTDRHIMPLPIWLLIYHLKKANFKVEVVKYSNGGIEIPGEKRFWQFKFLPHGKLWGNSVIIKAKKILGEKNEHYQR